MWLLIHILTSMVVKIKWRTDSIPLFARMYTHMFIIFNSAWRASLGYKFWGYWDAFKLTSNRYKRAVFQKSSMTTTVYSMWRTFKAYLCRNKLTATPISISLKGYCFPIVVPLAESTTILPTPMRSLSTPFDSGFLKCGISADFGTPVCYRLNWN